MMDEPTTRSLTVDEILADIEQEVYKNEKMIKLSVALEYMIHLVEPKYKEVFREAELKAKTVDDMTKILDLVKKHIGQKTAISMLGI
ncbi:MAG: hypothetical protein KAU14_01080 [Thermoplasmata archaeon]|nr:hypothetical protein [Thermoplasmata archaeon]